MLVPQNAVFCLFILAILQIIPQGHGGDKKGNKRGVRLPRKGVFQVLNQPKGGRTISKPIPKLVPPPPTLAPPIEPVEPVAPVEPVTVGTTTTPRQSPLLDFPEEDEGPLLDFPDPLDAELRRRFGGYDKACDTAKTDDYKKRAKRRTREGKEDIVHETETQNRRLKQALVKNAIEASPIPEHNPVYGFKLLDQTTQIFQTICPHKYVPNNFISNAVYAFKKLHHLTSTDRSEYLKPDLFKWISNILDECMNNTKPIKFFPDEACKEEVQAWKEKKNWICTPWREDFNKKVYDPLLDLIWHIYNAAHHFCFPIFDREGAQMLHTYGIAIMDLYSTPIKQRWEYNVEGNATETEFWDMILGPNHDYYFKNIERCTQGAANLNMKGNLIPRFVLGGPVRYDRDIQLGVILPTTA